MANKKGQKVIAVVELKSDVKPFVPDVIRTATILGRLPVHQLSKKGKVNIRIMERSSQNGRIELYWKVDDTNDAGVPRQIAYKLDTLFIQRKFNELGRPLPKLIRLGSLREIGREVGLGGDTVTVRKALSKNARVWITGKLKVKDAEGREDYFEFEDNRYGIAVRGTKLPNGRTAETVYLMLSEWYWNVLNKSPVRPLDYEYLKQLNPASQRWYELAGPQLFAAVKYKLPHVKMTYSDYCERAPQTRFYVRSTVQAQMSRVHRPHRKGTMPYIAGLKWNAITDNQGNPDWEILYTAGERAIAEYEYFNGLRSKLPAPPEPEPKKRPQKKLDERLLAEVTKRGVPRPLAEKLLHTVSPDRNVLKELEYGDYFIEAQAEKGSPVGNPTGLYVSFIRTAPDIPDSFESSRERELRDAAETAEREKQEKRIARTYEYEEAKRKNAETHIATLDESDRQRLLDERTEYLLTNFPKYYKKTLPDASIQQAAYHSLCKHFEETLPFPILPEWVEQQNREQGTTSSAIAGEENEHANQPVTERP